MQNCSLKRLKSGTDVRGTATGSDITLTDEAVYSICRAFVKLLNIKLEKRDLKVAVGNDSRISADRIFNCVKKALISSGCSVVYTGLSSTPSMFMLLQDWAEVDASIMITASHMPSNKNGLKFFFKDGGISSEDLDKLLSFADDGEHLVGEGLYEERSYMDCYSKSLVEKVRRSCGKSTPLNGKKIIVDAGNGAGGFFAEKVLKPLGADINGSQFLEPDGNFPNHIPNPEDKDAIGSLSKAVISCKADMGIIFDTDVDRAAAVDSEGKEINRNRLIALLSAILLKDKKGTIVTDSVTSDSLTDFIKNSGGEHLRYKRGYKNVIDKCIELNNNGIYSPLAIETSGHAAFKDNYYLDDGAYLITVLLIYLSSLKKDEKLCDVIANLKEPVESDEIRLSFNENSKDFKKEGAYVIEELKKACAYSDEFDLAPQNYEGARINFPALHGDGWTLLRMSVHDPVIVLNIESNSVGGVGIMKEKMFKLLMNFSFLNLDNLKILP